MSKFWLILLEKAIQQLLKADWETIIMHVMVIATADVSSDEKREYVVKIMKRRGYSGATWLLRAGIEVAYGMIKK
jgi:predicted Ser/Thr protein kinase